MLRVSTIECVKGPDFAANAQDDLNLNILFSSGFFKLQVTDHMQYQFI